MEPVPTIVELSNGVGREDPDKKHVKNGLTKYYKIVHLVHVVATHIHAVSCHNCNAEKVTDPSKVLPQVSSEGGRLTHPINYGSRVISVNTLIVLNNS